MGSIEIVCLANSRKTSGRCIAGKIISVNKWIRPVSGRVSEEISEEDRRYKNGEMPKLLDIIGIPVVDHKPSSHQKENYLINDKYYWKKIGVYEDSLKSLLDAPDDLWGTSSSSYQGSNDRVLEGESGQYSESLYLITPEKLQIIVRVEGEEFGDAKRKIRARFNYNSSEYLLPVTDPNVEKKYLAKDDGTYDIITDNVYICVSLGLAYNGYCYKFLTSLITN